METGVAVASAEAKAELNKQASSIAVGQKGSFRESARVDMGANHTDVNNILQFDIINNQVGAVAELVRIGSWLGQVDAYAKFGVLKSGVDSVNGISDNFGANLLMCQGFCDFTVATPMFVRTIKIISSDLTQLNKQFFHKTILPDFTVIPLGQNIAFTREKVDNAVDLLIAKGSWLLSSRDFLEFQSVAGQNVSIILELASISDVRQFVQF